MNKKVYIMIVGCVGLAVILIWLFSSSLNENKPSQQIQDNNSSAGTSINERSEASSGSDENIPDRPVGVSPDAWDKFVSGYKMGVKSNVPIVFYGKVVDEKSSPISGVEVTGLITSFDETIIDKLMSAKTDQKITQFTEYTDNNGLFVIKNTKGNSVSIKSITKAGYQIGSYNQNFGYAPLMASKHQPEVKNPVIFQMWNTENTQGLQLIEKFYGIIPDSRTYTLDLINNQKLEGLNPKGHLAIRINRPAGAIPRDKYAWSFELEAIDGGLIETTDSDLVAAPLDGYTSSFQCELASNAPKWRTSARRNFYFKSNDGKIYSGIKMKIISNYQNKAVAEISYTTSSNGSPILR
ncbi:MAG: hypothetical protein AAF571_13765 [Verrucomicrobiota bacterium]